MENRTNPTEGLAQSTNIHDGVFNEKSTPREFLMKYLNYLPIFILCIGGAFALSSVYLIYTNPIYNTTIKILIKQDDDQSAGNLSNEIVSKIFSNGKANISNELEIVRSETLMENVVRKLALNQTFYEEGNINTKELYDSVGRSVVHFDSISDSSKEYVVKIYAKNEKFYLKSSTGVKEIFNNLPVKQNGLQFTLHVNTNGKYDNGKIFIARWQPIIIAAEQLSKSIEIKQLNKESTIILLSINTEIKEKGQNILDAIAEVYGKLNVEEKNKVNRNTIKFLESRIAVISNELGGIENDLQQYRKVNNVISPEAQVTDAFSGLKAIKDKMDEIQVKVQVADLIKSYVNDPDRKFSLVPSSLGIEDITLVELVRAYNTDVLLRENLLKTVTAKNNEINKIEAQLATLQGKIIESVDNVKRSLVAAYTASKTEYNKISTEIGTVPEKQQEMLGKTRQQEIKEKLYIFLLEKKEQSTLNEASAISNNYPIDHALTEIIPVTPNKSAIYSVAILLGFGLPTLALYLLSLFNDKVITRSDVLRNTQTPLIGEINHTEAKDRKIISDKGRGVLSEQFRNLRTNLQFFKKSDDRQTILVTSSMPGEGKSFISLNIGAVFAATGRKTLIIELDLRKPKLSSALNIDGAAQGLTSYIVGSVDLNDIIRPITEGNLTNFFLLPSGPIPPNPSELILDAKMGELFSELKKRFDFIIIDTPPIGVVSDARILSQFSDVNVYIVRQRYTLKRQLKIVNDLYEGRVLTNMAIVVNDVVNKGANSYYGYGGYGYGYGGYSYNYSYGNGYGYGDIGKEEYNFLQKIGNFFRFRK